MTNKGNFKRQLSIRVRQTWKNQADFLLALISYGVGLGNVWRFPYLAYSSGGGAFLIPFITSSIVVGIPFALLEVALGQWMREGGIGAWDISPILKGIGFANLIIVFLGNVYYEVILAWALRYLVASFSYELPWKTCKHEWNSECCSETLLLGKMSSASNLTANLSIASNCTSLVDPITEYWERNILNITSGIDSLGAIKTDLLIALFASWLIVYFSIFKGMKNSQIAVYITAILPYLFLFAFLIMGLRLPGAWKGITYFLEPNWNKLVEFQVWADAGTQVFYSYGIGIAALVSLGSYNNFHHNSYRDVTLFTIINTLTSILSGFVIFSILGYMAHIRGVDISLVAEEGPGLAFIVYPQALALLPWSPLWSVMFFIMLFLLGLGTQLVATEAITTAIMDEYVHVLHRRVNFKYFKETLSGITVCLSFLCGLPMVTAGGMYVFQIFDYYAASRSLLFVGLFEIIAVSYVYGANRFHRNVQIMWKTKLTPWLKVMWYVVTPAFTLVLIVFTIMSYEDLTYNRTYKYPKWALNMGWFLSLLSLLCIPLYTLIRMCRSKGSVKERFLKLTKPVIKAHQLEYEIDHAKENPNDIQANEQSNPKKLPDIEECMEANKHESDKLVQNSSLPESTTISTSRLDDDDTAISIYANSQTFIKT